MSNPEWLAHLPLFSSLSAAERRELSSQIVESSYGKGEYIFREGDPAEWFHIVKEGTVKCVKSSADGRDVTLKYLLPGDLFCCEAAVFDGSAHPGCAKVLDQAKVVRIKKQAYFDFLRRNPDAALSIIQYLGVRLKEAQEHAKTFAFDHAEQRIASILLTLAQKAGITEPAGIRLGIRLTRKDLADMAGLTVETATRIMSRFKKQDIVKGTAKCLMIINMPYLQTLRNASPLIHPEPRHSQNAKT